MTRYLLDTDGVIDCLKGFKPTIDMLQPLVDQRNEICICAVVLGETHAGLRPQARAQAMKFIQTLVFLPASAQAAEQAGQWKYEFARQGRILSLTDCLIAAVAQENNAYVVTRNTKDFPMSAIRVLPLPRPQNGRS